MDKVSKMIRFVTSRQRLFDQLKTDNPFLGMSWKDLLQMLQTGQVPENGTFKHDQFQYALLQADHEDRQTGRKRQRPLAVLDGDKVKAAAVFAADQAAQEAPAEDPMEAFNRLYYPGGNKNG